LTLPVCGAVCGRTGGGKFPFLLTKPLIKIIWAWGWVFCLLKRGYEAPVYGPCSESIPDSAERPASSIHQVRPRHQLGQVLGQHGVSVFIFVALGNGFIRYYVGYVE